MNSNGAPKPADSRTESLRILDDLPNPMWRSNLEGMCDYFNHTWLTFTGRSLEEELGRGWVAGVHPDDVELVQGTLLPVVQACQPFKLTFRLRHYSGEFRWIEAVGQPYISPAGESSGSLVTCYDVSERVVLEQGLRSREALFKGLFEAAPDGVVAVDEQGCIRLINRHGLEMFGFQAEELIGQEIEFLLPEEYRARHSHHIRSFMEHPRRRPMGAGLDLYGQRKNGEIFPADIMLGPVQVGDQTWVLATIRDITDRKRTESELDRYRAQLEELVQQRTEALERSNRDLQDFAFIASHDLQEPLRKVITFGERLETRWQESLDDTGKDYLKRMTEAASRMQNMLNALLAYSRVSTSDEQPELVSLNAVLADVISDLEVRIEETGGRVEVADLPALQAEPSQMRQLFQNLLSNALKFHREGVPPVVKVYTAPTSSKTVEIRVEDNGIGFDDAYLEKVFQPFTRLHGRSEYEGSGIGLAVCRKIMERHGGSLTATSQEGRGSTFIIKLPK